MSWLLFKTAVNGDEGSVDGGLVASAACCKLAKSTQAGLASLPAIAR